MGVGVVGSRRGCGVIPDVMLWCRQSCRLWVAEAFGVRQDLPFLVDLCGQSPQCRWKRQLVLVLVVG